MRIIREYRNNFRVSLGKEHVILRIPKFTFSSVEDYIRKAEEWLLNIEQQKPDILSRYKYQDQIKPLDYQITVLGKYNIRIIHEITNENRNYSIFDEEGSTLILRVSSTLEYREQKKILSRLIFTFLNKKFLPELDNLVRQYNSNYFNKQIRSVKLKNNTSNWGSCSSSGNINISAKTILLPYEHLEYVIIHELAHLVELNHSRAYWKVVEDILPGYKYSESWLRENGFRYGI